MSGRRERGSRSGWRRDEEVKALQQFCTLNLQNCQLYGGQVFFFFFLAAKVAFCTEKENIFVFYRAVILDFCSVFTHPSTQIFGSSVCNSLLKTTY